VATFHQSLDDDEHATSFSVNDVDRYHDHQGHHRDDRHQDLLDHLDRHPDDRHLGRQSRHLDDQHLGHLGDQVHLDDQHPGHQVRVFLDQKAATGHLFQQDHDLKHLQEYDPYARRHQDHQGDQHLDHPDDRPSVDDQHPVRHQDDQEVAELDDRYLEVAESDDQMGLLEEAAEGVVLPVQVMQQTARSVWPAQIAQAQAPQVRQEQQMERAPEQEQGQLCPLVAQK
jgi:hypothetical protein